MTGKIPKISELPQRTRTYLCFSKSGRSIEKITVEIDIDANKEDIEAEIRSITDSKKIMQKMNHAPKKVQPIRNFNELLLLIKSYKNIALIADKKTDWSQENKTIKENMLKNRNRLKTQRSRYKKIFSKMKRIPVSKRKDYEEYIKTNKVGF